MAGESFVDVRYRGLDLGRRLKMHEFGPETAYLEHATPMPVGAALEIETDDGLRVAATVVRVCEQVAGAERPPGMRVRQGELDEAAQSWWQEHVTVADPVEAEIPEEEVAAVATGVGGAQEEAAEASAEEAEASAEAEADGARKGEEGEIVDDGKQTEIMSAVVVPEDAGTAAPAPEPEPEGSGSGKNGHSGVVVDAASVAAHANGETNGDATKKKRGRRGRRKKR